jgi:hypothetical protein
MPPSVCSRANGHAAAHRFGEALVSAENALEFLRQFFNDFAGSLWNGAI